MSEPRYFQKFSHRQALYLSNGKSVKFDPVDADYGVLVTDNPTIIAEFRAAMKAQRGGLSEITAEEYQAKKKIVSERPSLLVRKREEIVKGLPKAFPTRPVNHVQPAGRSTIPEVAVGDINALRPKASR